MRIYVISRAPAERYVVRSDISPTLHDDLTARRTLRFYAGMHDQEPTSSRATDLLDHVGPSLRLGDLVHTFSRRTRQRLSVARTVMHES